MSRIAVIGGGISGLVVASELAFSHQDVDVRVYERSTRAGGVVASTVQGGYLMESGVNGFLPSPGGAVDLCESLGIEVQAALPATRKRWVFDEGQLKALPRGPVELLRSAVISKSAKLSLALEPFKPKADSEESVSGFLTRRLGKELGGFIAPLLVTGIFAGDPDALSVDAAFPWLKQLEHEGGLIRGSVRRARVAKKNRAPARQTLAPKGGVDEIIAALASGLGARLKLDSEVVALKPDARGVVVTDASGETRFDKVVLAASAHHSAKLLAPLDRELASSLGAIDYVPISVVFLGYRNACIPEGLDGFGVLVQPNQGLSTLGAVFESELWPNRAPKGHRLIRCLMGGSRDPELAHKGSEAIGKLAQDEMRTILGLQGSASMQEVVTWPRAIPQYRLGHRSRVRAIESAASSHHIFLAGSAYHGVSFNDCIRSARILAHNIALLVLVGLLLSCAGKSGTPRASESDEEAEIDIESEPPLKQSKITEPVRPGTGRLIVTPSWLWPPSRLRDDQRFNACGAPRDPAISVHLMGGVHDALVEVGGLPPREPGGAFVDIRECRPRPRTVSLVSGSALSVRNTDEAPRRVFLQKVGGQKGEGRSFDLRVVGQSVEIALDDASFWRLWTDHDPQSVTWIWVSEFEVLKSDERGEARLWEVPAGTYTVRAFHPPVDESVAYVMRDAEIEVEAGITTEMRLDMKSGG